jgi:uncharacterized protein YjbJ (UPF0337 family)
MSPAHRAARAALDDSEASLERSSICGVVEHLTDIKGKVMGSKADQASGLANEAIGNVKQGIGKAVGNDKLRAEGALQEAKGEAQQAVGKAKAGVKDAADKVADKINEKL